MNNTIRLWDTENGKPKLTFKTKNDKQPPDQNNRVRDPYTIISLAYTPDGKTLVGGSRDGKIHFWDIEREGHRQTFAEQEFPAIFLECSSNDKMITGEMYSKINIWDIPKQQLIRTINIRIGGRGGINSVSFSPDGKTVAGGSDESTIYLWNTETGTLRQKLSTYTGKVTSVAYSPDGSTFASAGEDRVIRIWDALTGKQIRILSGHFGSAVLVAYSHDGNKLASTSNDGTILLWDISNVNNLRELKFGNKKSQNITQWNLPEGASARLGKGLVKDIAYSPDGNHLAVASTVGTWIYDVHTGDEVDLFTGPMSSIEQVLYSPDGRILLGRNSHEVYLLDVATGKYLHTLSLNSGITNDVSKTTFGYSRDGGMLVSWGQGGSIQLWDAVTGQNIHTIEGSWNTQGFAFSPDGSTIAYSIRAIPELSNKVHLWDVKTSKNKQTLSGHKHQVESIVFSPDGKTLASLSKPSNWSRGTSKMDILLWDAETGNLKHTLTYDKYVRLVTYSPDGKTLAVAVDKLIYLYDVHSGKLENTLLGYAPFVFSPDGKTIAVNGFINTISLWNAVLGTPLRPLNGPLAVTSLQYSPDGKTLTALDDYNNMVCVWDVDTGKLKHTFEYSDYIRTLVFSPDGKTLAAGGIDSTIRLWDVTSRTQRLELNTSFIGVDTIAYSPDGNTIAANSEYNTVLLWDASNGNQKQKLKLDGDLFYVRSIVYSPYGKTLAINGSENSIELWDALNGTHKQTLNGHTKPVESLAYSPDGKTLASGSSDSNIILWDASTGEYKRTLSDNDNTLTVSTVVFSPDGTTLASEWGYGIHLWDLESGQMKFKLSQGGRPVAYSPDGTILASGGGSGFIHLWNAHTGELKKMLYGHHKYQGVKSLVFSPDGNTLASGSNDGTILLWDLTDFKTSNE